MANEGSTKPTNLSNRCNIETTDDGLRVCLGHHEKSAGCEWEYYVPKDSLARVRGLLQRQWISVEERLPKVGEMVLLYVGGSVFIETGWRCFDGQTHIFQLERTAPQDEPITYEVADGRVTEWMPLPAPPTFPQSSSLVPEGAESADIGKLDRVPLIVEIERETDSRWLADVPSVPGVMAYGTTRADAAMNALILLDNAVAGSAETGGEKAAQQLTDEQIIGWTATEMHEDDRDDPEQMWEDLSEPERNSYIKMAEAALRVFKVSQMSPKEVEVALAESSLSSPPPCFARKLNPIRFCQLRGGHDGDHQFTQEQSGNLLMP